VAGAHDATALMLAAEAGKIDAVRTLIDARVDVNAKTNEMPGRTAIDFAKANGHDDVVTALEATGGHAGVP
jgi:ankyrin repeat protein